MGGGGGGGALAFPGSETWWSTGVMVCNDDTALLGRELPIPSHCCSVNPRSFWGFNR